MRRFFVSLIIAILAMMVAESITSDDALAQFPVLVVDTLVSNRLAEEWEPTNRYQHERGYCVRYETDYAFSWTGPIVVYTLTGIVRADEEQTTGSSIKKMICPPTADAWVFLHTHPPTECTSSNDWSCKVGGAYANQCYPSDTDMRTLNHSDKPFSLLQCDRNAIVPYWRTAPLPPALASGAHRSFGPVGATVLNPPLRDLPGHIDVEARPTHSPSVLVRAEVRARQRMSCGAVSLSGVSGTGVIASQDVDARSHGFDVPRVEAGAIAAQMVSLKFGRQVSVGNFVGEPVDVAEPNDAVKHRTCAYVTARLDSPGPNPALIGARCHCSHSIPQRRGLSSHADVLHRRSALRSIQCDTHAITPYWRTDPLPLADSLPSGSHRLMGLVMVLGAGRSSGRIK